MNEFTIVRQIKDNFENKSLEQLKEMRKNFDLTNTRSEDQALAYLIRMIDILLEKVEILENDSKSKITT